jgi:phosphate transport system substrate-binding protein
MLKMSFRKSLFFPIMSIMLIFIIVLIEINGCSKTKKNDDVTLKNGDLSGTITISGAFALYPLTVKWAEEFHKIYPKVRIDISAGGAGKGMADALSGTVDLGMFSREIMPAEKERGVWWLAVTKDAVLPTISSENPLLAELQSKGLTRDDFKSIFVDQTIRTWGAAVGTDNRDEINVYTRSDACGAAGTWARYLGGVQEDLKGIGVYADPGLADAVKKDPLGIGYNNTIYIYSTKTNAKYPGLEVIPLDINANGMIDPDENFYDRMNQVMAAIAMGKYPSPPARELYFVAKGKPASELVIQFLQWILIDGQQYVSEAGYVSLSQEVINNGKAKLR